MAAKQRERGHLFGRHLLPRPRCRTRLNQAQPMVCHLDGRALQGFTGIRQLRTERLELRLRGLLGALGLGEH